MELKGLSLENASPSSRHAGVAQKDHGKPRQVPIQELLPQGGSSAPYLEMETHWPPYCPATESAPHALSPAISGYFSRIRNP